MLFELMHVKPRNPYLNLALDEAVAVLLGEWSQRIGINGGIRFWSNKPSIILGRTDDPVENLAPQASLYVGNRKKTHRHPKLVQKSTDTPHTSPKYLARRLSGGGTVLHNANALNYSIFLDTRKHPDLRSIPKSYDIFLQLICRALSQQKIKVVAAGQSDLALLCEDGKLRKVAGNAQFRKKSVTTFHGTLILHPSLIKEIITSLSHPTKEPPYRKLRSHHDFLTHLPLDFNLSIFYDSIVKELTNLTGDYISAPLAIEERQSIYKLAISLVKKRYAQADWILGNKIV